MFEFFHSFLGLQGVHKTWNTYNIIFDVLNSGRKKKQKGNENKCRYDIITTVIIIDKVFKNGPSKI